MNTEILIVLLVIGISILPIFALRCFFRNWIWGILLCTGIFTAVSIFIWHNTTSSTLSKKELHSKSLPYQRVAGGYVSSSKCRSCHPSEYSSWYHTYHRTMTLAALPESVVGNLDKVNLKSKSHSFYLEQRNNEFWVQEIYHNPKTNKDEIGTWNQILMTTGSHQTQIYWVRGPQANQLRIFPFAYLILKDKWVPLADAFLKYPEQVENENLFWNFNCIQCHATAGQSRPHVTGKTNTRVGELGIACESCHGPARNHVLINQDPLQRYQNHFRNKSDSTIVNPNRESHRSSSQICGQCHGIFYILDLDHAKQHGFQYRPGDDLEKTKPTIRPKQAKWRKIVNDLEKQDPTFLSNRFWPDGMVRVGGREYNGLLESPCYQKGTMSCLSCHSMHNYQARADQLSEGMEGDQACLGCHASYRKQITQHTHHPKNSAGSRCYNCHMPYTAYGLLKAQRSHQIDNPSVHSSIKTGRPNACNLCHLDQSLAWTQTHLSQWYQIPAVNLTQEQKEISAVLLWLLRGDAGQRALAAITMGWNVAREASGENWLAPFLAELLDDPYTAVRFLAGQSLWTIQEFKELEYDSQASSKQRIASKNRALEIWERSQISDTRRTGKSILIKSDGRVDREKMLTFLSQRNDRKMDLSE